MVEATGLSKAAIYFWLGGRKVSAECAARIEEATEGAVTLRELRPDLFGDPTPAPSTGATAKVA